MTGVRPGPIDLNADVGEGPGEEPLYRHLTSANVACGGHAGDPRSMRAAVQLALRHGVVLGAHPGYPDRERFGRMPLDLPPAEIARHVHAQVLVLARIVEAEGGFLRHVKPHGALYHQAATDAATAAAIAHGVAAWGRDLVLVGFAGSTMLAVWAGLGFRVAAEGFADRVYEPDGSLRPRTRSRALLVEPRQAADQALRMALGGQVRTLCVHADTPGAGAILEAVRDRLERAGVPLRSLAD